MEIYYRTSVWDYLKLFLDFSLICTLLRAYMPNAQLHLTMFPPSLLLVIRMVVHLLFDFQFYFYKHVILQNYNNIVDSAASMNMNFISGVMIVMLIILMKMENLFYNTKGITFMTRILGAIATFLYVGSGSVLIPRKTSLINVVWISLSAFVKWLIMVVLCKSLHESSDNQFSDTEKKDKQVHKFKSCFDNIKESIILINSGQIEYVNDSFLLQFSSSINKLQYTQRTIEIPKITLL